MYAVTPKTFRIACVAALIFLSLTALSRSLGMVVDDPDVSRALRWSYLGATAPVWFIWATAITYFILSTVGFIGALWFWGPSRWCLASSFLLSVLTRPFLGLVVVSSTTATLMGIYGLCHALVTVVSFWSPLAQCFAKRRDPNAT